MSSAHTWNRQIQPTNFVTPLSKKLSSFWSLGQAAEALVIVKALRDDLLFLSAKKSLSVPRSVIIQTKVTHSQFSQKYCSHAGTYDCTVIHHTMNSHTLSYAVVHTSALPPYIPEPSCSQWIHIQWRQHARRSFGHCSLQSTALWREDS